MKGFMDIFFAKESKVRVQDCGDLKVVTSMLDVAGLSVTVEASDNVLSTVAPASHT